MTLPASDPMLDSYMGHAGAIGGVYVICIWGVQQMGVLGGDVNI